MTLCLVPEILDTVDMGVTVGKELGMVDAEMVKVGHIQHIIAPPAVGVDDTVRDDFSLDDRHQGGGGGIWNDLGVNPAAPL